MTSSVAAGRGAYAQRLRDWPVFLDPPLHRAGDTWVLGIVVAAGLLFDLGIRSGVAGLAGALAITFLAAALIASRRLRSAHAIGIAAAAPLFGVWLALRTSVWLVPFDVIAAAALLALAASLSAGGSLWDLSIPQAAARAFQAGVQALLAPSFLIASRSGTTKHRFGGIVRGLAIVLPLVIVLGALLASADALFSNLFRFDATSVIGHGVLIAVGAIGMGTLLRIASLEDAPLPSVRAPRLGSTEWTVVLGALNLLFAAFAVVQLVALSEGGKRVIRTSGLTYAEYARSGFFQLLAAATITLVALLALRAAAEIGSGERGRFVALASSMIALTLIVVVTAFSRVVLYERAFGLTMLRLYAQAAIVFVGVVLILLGLSIAGVGRDKTWVPSAAGVLALAMLLAMNVLNPEAFVVRHNLNATPTVRPDQSYVYDLSDDAVPELARDATNAAALRGPICAPSPRDHWRGWAAFNLSHERANTARTTIGCSSPRGD